MFTERYAHCPMAGERATKLYQQETSAPEKVRPVSRRNVRPHLRAAHQTGPKPATDKTSQAPKPIKKFCYATTRSPNDANLFAGVRNGRRVAKRTKNKSRGWPWLREGFVANTSVMWTHGVAMKLQFTPDWPVRCQFNFIVIPLYLGGVRAPRGDRTPGDPQCANDSLPP